MQQDERVGDGGGGANGGRKRRAAVILAILAAAAASASDGEAQVRPTVPRTLPPTAPTTAPASAPTTAPPTPNQVPPSLVPSRPTPAVIMTVVRNSKHATFTRDKLRPVVRGRRPIAPPALPNTLGASGPALAAGGRVLVDIDGRTVAAGDYRADTDKLESYLNQRGITQRTKEPARRVRDIKRAVPRAQLPATGGLLRPNVNAIPRTAAPAKSLGQANAAMWESGESVTLDEYTSANEVKRPPPIRKPPPPPEPAEVDRPDQVTTWYYKSGGEVGLDVDTDGSFAAGRTRRKAGASMRIRGYVAGIDFPLFDTSASIESRAEHTWDKTNASYGSKPGPHTKGGSLAIMGMAMEPMTGFVQPASWRKPDSWKVSMSVPIGPFTADFSLMLEYLVGGGAKLGLAPDGLAVDAAVGPEFGAGVELTAGVGIAGFSVGVGGHVALLGNKDASGPATFTRSSFSRYEEAGSKQRMKTSIDSQVYALSGNLFVFVDTWWDRYDTEIFDWTGLRLGGDTNGDIDILWGTMQEPDYGPLRELRAFACKQKNLSGSRFAHDWTATTRTKAEMIAGGCELIGGPNDIYYGKLASKWNPDTVPVVECRFQTAWLGGIVGDLPNLQAPVGKGPFAVNEFPVALFSKTWTSAPTDAEVLAAGQAQCERERVGSGQVIDAFRIAGYAWKTKGDVILDVKSKTKAPTREHFRCAANWDWWSNVDPAGCPGGPAGYMAKDPNFYVIR